MATKQNKIALPNRTSKKNKPKRGKSKRGKSFKGGFDPFLHKKLSTTRLRRRKSSKKRHKKRN